MRQALLLAATIALAACSRAPVGPHDTVFVSDEKLNLLHVIDGATGEDKGTIRTGARPRGMVVSPDGKSLYVAAGNANRIDVIDLATRKVTRSLDSGTDPERFAVSPDGRRLFVANEDHATASIIDIAANKAVCEVPVGAVVSEYVDVAKAFFDGREAGFANGLLDAIGKDVRSSD